MWCEIFCEKSERQKRKVGEFFRMLSFFSYAIADVIFNLLFSHQERFPRPKTKLPRPFSAIF
jgi:hypothetical protein